MFTDSQLKVVRFCAQECERQESGEISVANMVEAWDCATVEMNDGIAVEMLDGIGWSPNLVLELGYHVEPKQNRDGFRRWNVNIDLWPIPADTIPENIDRLMDNQGYWFNDEMAAEFYQAFERIHPFIDGNGRVGAILYNLLLGRMDDPITPPKFRR